MSTMCTNKDAICLNDAVAMQVTAAPYMPVWSFFRATIAWILAREDKRLSRLALGEMTDEQLADIGVTAAEARREAARPYWR